MATQLLAYSSNICYMMCIGDLASILLTDQLFRQILILISTADNCYNKNKMFKLLLNEKALLSQAQ